MRIGPVGIAFDAEDPFPVLIIISDLAAWQDAGEAGIGLGAIGYERPVGIAPIDAERGAEIEAGPIIGGDGQRDARNVGAAAGDDGMIRISTGSEGHRSWPSR